MSLPALLLLSLLNIFNYLDRYLVAANLPAVMADFSLTQEQAGRLVSAFVCGYFLFSPLFGFLGDRVRRPILMSIGAVLWGLATIATGLASTYSSFILARIAVGIGEASFGTIAPGYLRDRIADPQKLNSAFSVFFCAIPVGSALGYVLSGFIVQSHPWQYAFFVGGLPAILIGVLILRYPEVRLATVVAPAFKESIIQVSRIRVLWYAIGGYVLNSFALTGIATFVTKYGVQIGFQLGEISQYFGIVLVITGLAGTFGGGWLSNRLCQKSKSKVRRMLQFVSISAVCGVPFIWIAFASSNHYTFLVCCFLAELLIFAGTAPINSVIVLSSPEQLVTFTQGLTIFSLNLGGSLLAPILVGFIADTVSLSAGMWTAGFALLGCGFLWWVGSRYGNVPIKEAGHAL